jgi:hypothetical protein
MYVFYKFSLHYLHGSPLYFALIYVFNVLWFPILHKSIESLQHIYVIDLCLDFKKNLHGSNDPKLNYTHVKDIFYSLENYFLQ